VASIVEQPDALALRGDALHAAVRQITIDFVRYGRRSRLAKARRPGQPGRHPASSRGPSRVVARVGALATGDERMQAEGVLR
jgi:hypothetical protein